MNPLATHVVLANGLNPDANDGAQDFKLGPCDWMKGTRSECESKAARWQKDYRSVQVHRLAD